LEDSPVSSEGSEGSEQSWIVEDHWTETDLEELHPIDKFQIAPVKVFLSGSPDLQSLQGYSLSGQGLPVDVYRHTSPLMSRWSQDLLRDVKRCCPAPSREDVVEAVKRLRPASTKSYIQGKIKSWCSVQDGKCQVNRAYT